MLLPDEDIHAPPPNRLDDYLEQSIADQYINPGWREVPKIPYFPNRKYLEKNWKPEQIDENYLQNLAAAQKLAQRTGVLSPALAKQFLPLMLTEHREYDSGNNTRFPVNPMTKALGDKMGLSPSPLENYDRTFSKESYYGPNTGDYSMRGMDISSQENARLAAMVLAIKGRGRTPEQAVERWNGQGQVYQSKGGVPTLVADAGQHRKKVALMNEMITHPANTKLREKWNALMAAPE